MLRRLHQWKPHDGKPISSFFFLDNLASPSQDAYWKYAITLADDNKELKAWFCSKWECIQTLNIQTHNGADVKFIAEMDRTASYIVLSNIETKVFYVLQIATNCDQDIATKKKTLIEFITEFPLSSSILSFTIVDAVLKKYHRGSLEDSCHLEEMEDFDDESTSEQRVEIRTLIIQPNGKGFTNVTSCICI